MSWKRASILTWVQYLVVIALVFAGSTPAGYAGQDGSDEGRRGPGPSAQNEELTLFDFVGHIKQDGLTVVAYGYLTHVYGMDDQDLFTGRLPLASEADAKYTFVTRGTFESRFVVGDGTPGNNIITISTTVSSTFYFRDPPSGGCVGVPSSSCPEDPSPFESGTPIAAAAGRNSDVNNIQGPNKGVLTGSGAVTLTEAPSKRGGHAPLPLWKPGTKIRINYVGEATRTDPAGPKSYSLIVGRATVIR
jgi:hypothetical protein